MNTNVPAVNMSPTQIKELIPMIYIMANSIMSPMTPPPRYQIYWALSPRNSIALFIPLLILYILFAIMIFLKVSEASLTCNRNLFFPEVVQPLYLLYNHCHQQVYTGSAGNLPPSSAYKWRSAELRH